MAATFPPGGRAQGDLGARSGFQVERQAKLKATVHQACPLSQNVRRGQRIISGDELKWRNRFSALLIHAL